MKLLWSTVIIVSLFFVVGCKAPTAPENKPTVVPKIKSNPTVVPKIKSTSTEDRLCEKTMCGSKTCPVTYSEDECIYLTIYYTE